MSVTDLTSFYEALVEGLLAREATESYVVVKVPTDLPQPACSRSMSHDTTWERHTYRVHATTDWRDTCCGCPGHDPADVMGSTRGCHGVHMLTSWGPHADVMAVVTTDHLMPR